MEKNQWALRGNHHPQDFDIRKIDCRNDGQVPCHRRGEKKKKKKPNRTNFNLLKPSKMKYFPLNNAVSGRVFQEKAFENGFLDDKCLSSML